MNGRQLNEAERQELADLETRSGDAVDTSDIAEISDSQWQLARRGDLYRPIKKSVTIRLDADVIAWFKENASGGYQTEINSVLRRHVSEQEKKSA
ncbi:BrnA antitoxin family protein [Neorhizobium alkalisoli]|uniref:Uncharacterized protein (DUF4415 family) n=1 Tax=Neorhizobium alkalisoli TaxID=528178 RepID=A0A561QVB8_9HYPH|nr:BrnA antitoxin family protein [Neorhizobium alkalisoli]TWF54318.1 uncharacterized protein (DUF4415 family) [Neorhizobium alkalisoli]